MAEVCFLPPAAAVDQPQASQVGFGLLQGGGRVCGWGGVGDLAGGAAAGRRPSRIAGWSWPLAAVERHDCPKCVLAVGAQLDREYIREKTLEGQQAAAARGNHGGRPQVIDDDMLIFARALRDKGVLVPEIAKKLTVTAGKNAGKHPSVASLYRALAEADEAA